MNIFISDDDMCTTQKLNLARVQKWFEANNCKVTEDANKADKVLVMTCNGFSLLEERSLKRIENYKKNHKDKMITVGCMIDSHPEDVAKIWDGPVVKTNSKKTMSFSDIENLYPEFKTSLDSIPAQSVLVLPNYGIIIKAHFVFSIKNDCTKTLVMYNAKVKIPATLS